MDLDLYLWQTGVHEVISVPSNKYLSLVLLACKPSQEVRVLFNIQLRPRLGEVSTVNQDVSWRKLELVMPTMRVTDGDNLQDVPPNLLHFLEILFAFSFSEILYRLTYLTQHFEC